MTAIPSPAGTRPGFAALLLLGMLLLLMGVPFTGMAIMASLLLSGRGGGGGVPWAVVVLVGVFFVTDFVGALIAATGSGIMAMTLRSGRDLAGAVALASAAAALASITGLLLLPGISLLSSGSVETLMQVYATAGLSPEETGRVLGMFLYIVPSLLALWAVGGTVAAGAAVKLMSVRTGQIPFPRGEEIRLGLLPAWIMILCLGINLTLIEFPAEVRQGAVNALVFLALPYLLVGLSVARAALRNTPGMLMPVALFSILLPPAAIGVLILLGITDTLFDFRLRLAKLKERNQTT
jgi:hypothetical protein